MIDENYEVLASRVESVRSRLSREMSATREHLHGLISEVQHLQADIAPLLEDLRERKSGEEQVALLRQREAEYRKIEWERRCSDRDSELAALAQRQAELDAAMSRRVNVGAVLIRLAALLMLLSLPAAFILSALGAITPEQQTNALAGTALLAIGGGAIVLWDILKEADA